MTDLLSDHILRDMYRSGLHHAKLIYIPGNLLQQNSTQLLPVFTGLYPIPEARPLPAEGGFGCIEPFAAVHHYRLISGTLKKNIAAIRKEQGFPKNDFRVFSNSPLPERAVAAAAGLGWVGRNGLLMNRTYGSSFIIAGVLLSGDAAESILAKTVSPAVVSSLKAPENLHRICGSCRECEKACPTGAIRPEGGIDTGRCLQALATKTGQLPEFALKNWGMRIYGCGICQRACPVNKNRDFRAPPLSPEAEQRNLRELLAVLSPYRDASLKSLFPGTALEAGWIPKEAIVRNILIAAGNSAQPDLEPLIQILTTQSENELPSTVMETAAWAMKKIRDKKQNKYT